MRLRWSPSSPFTRKVLVVAAEVGLYDEIELLPTNAREQPPDLIAGNPLGKIPVLVLDEGVELVDSRVICEYLDARVGGGIFPSTGPKRWLALRQQAIADGLMEAAVLVVQEKRRGERASAENIATQLGRVTRAVATMSQEIDPQDCTIGSIASAVALSYLDFRFPEVPWRTHTSLASWYSTFSERPSMMKTVLKEKEKIRELDRSR